MNVHELVQQFSGVAAAERPMIEARNRLNQLKSAQDDIVQALDFLSGTGGNALQAFYRSPDLSLLKVSFPTGRRTPPHNHGTWAAILVLSGQEKNTLYRRQSNGELKRAGEVILSAGDVLPMTENTVHVVECMSDEPAVGLHVYGANVLGVERQMWDPDTLEEQPLDWSRYEELAQRASAASASPLTD